MWASALSCQKNERAARFPQGPAISRICGPNCETDNIRRSKTHPHIPPFSFPRLTWEYGRDAPRPRWPTAVPGESGKPRSSCPAHRTRTQGTRSIPSAFPRKAWEREEKVLRLFRSAEHVQFCPTGKQTDLKADQTEERILTVQQGTQALII